MKLFLRDFETFPAQTRLEAGPDTIKVEFDGLVDVKHTVVDIDIQQSGEEYFCQAEISADVTLECARCLKHFDCKLKARSDFIVCSEATFAEQRQEADDDEDYVFYRGDSMAADLTEQVRQAIILAMPMIPVCAEDCKGLCPKCRVDRNKEECDCTFDDTDPRWEKLKDLKK